MTPRRMTARLTQQRPALGFLAALGGWTLLLLGVLRSPWVQQHLLVPFAGLQKGLACLVVGEPRAPLAVGTSCSGADAIALCIGAVLAFPAPWRRRLTGCLAGLAVIATVNTVRLGNLAVVAGDRRLFEPLHLIVWPTLVVLAGVGFFLVWAGPGGRPAARLPALAARLGSSLAGRYLGLAAAALAVFYLAVPWLRETAPVLEVSRWVAAAGGWVLAALGVAVEVRGSLLKTGVFAWRVTPECVLTPMIALYLATLLCLSMSPTRRALAAAAALPLFLLLAVARLLVVALPPAVVGSPFVAVHAFYQMVAGVALAAGLAHHWRRGWSGAGAAVAVGGAAGLGVVAAGSALAPLLATAAAPALHLGHGWSDPQGALALLPAFQVGLLTALVVAVPRRPRPRRLLAAFCLLAAAQALLAVAAGELARHLGLETPVVVLRAAALGVPLALVAWLRAGAAANAGRRRLGRATPLHAGGEEGATFRDFWATVGREFPDLGGAASTDYYLEGEQRLFADHLPALDGLRVFKTDLWDECRNTRILRWAAGRGAVAFGIDISPAVTVGARREFSARSRRLASAISDVRSIPFADGSFDAVYSMGTIEHFAETETAVGEIFRVLAPGGRAIVGVPNRHDPFLRPMLVAVLLRLGLYAYGFERSYSHRQLRSLLESCGLRVVAEDGLLFLPGWLRMLDLACHAWARPLCRLTAPAVGLFRWLDRRFPRLHRHGYLIAAVVEKPMGPGTPAAVGPAAGSGPVHPTA